MAEDSGMAEKVEKAVRDPRVADITPERVQQIFELNQTLDDMVMVFMGLLAKTIDNLPNNQGKLAFMRKLQNAINQKDLEVRGTIF